MRSSASSSVAEHDAVIIGSGVNSLACGALLARAGWRVCVLERNEWLGGAIRTAEITEPVSVRTVVAAAVSAASGGFTLKCDRLRAASYCSETKNATLSIRYRRSGRR